MVDTFPWQMDMGASADTQYRVNKTQFGDGYSQHSSFGINNIIKNWSGTKTGDWDTVIAPILDFLDAHAGVKPFLWTDPHGKTKQYTCAGASTPQRKGNFWQITLNFEQFMSV
ncbi:phage tail protein [Psychrobacter sp. NPDC078501]|uniref:phage tail protein n=1 Tax=Psychrobacter sp. NPDC078501 TaxID=3364495 RepID=UPI00384C5B37